jgi:nucleotide-binding universal stress UspA family protein
VRGEPSFKRFLVPVDDSVPSLVSQELAVSIAKKFDSKVTLLYTVSHELMIPRFASLVSEVEVGGFAPGQMAREFSMPGRIAPPSGSTLHKEISGEITGWYHQKGEEIIGEASRLFKAEGIPVDSKMFEHQDPADTIIRQAEQGNHDIIIIGRSGEEEKQPHLGSVAEKVSRHAKIPVLIATAKNKISKILTPIDGSKSAEKALKYAVALAQKIDAKITLLYVQESGLFGLRPELAKEIGSHILTTAAKNIKQARLDQRLESGDPSKTITAIADKENYDIIVMGNKGQSAARRFLLGSVSDHVLHYANRSVLIVR